MVLKKIHRGGTHTAGQLANQLDYLFSKAEWTGGNIVDFDPSRKALTPKERAEIVTNWSDGWTRSPKNGHTTHLLLSLPQHVKPATARAIAADWAAEMFESGAYGDELSYVAALHTDRSHPHVHIVVQNRGVQEGSWFYMAKDHVFNLDVMKERMATVAEDHGVKLETTSRVERGILSYGPSRAEIEAARRGPWPLKRYARSPGFTKTSRFWRAWMRRKRWQRGWRQRQRRWRRAGPSFRMPRA
ncbi:relaxase/mobilization nuclease domain-containing protein [Yoonia sp.]|uniref:relaxase/mobilization nuclease domain-containing protein n=1 Tax=Yoonia sp. TaxID=2212373 RepID=UPI004047B4BC